MPTMRTAAQILDQEFLAIRHALLDVAAALDRLDRGPGGNTIGADPRVARLRQGIGVLADNQPNRAERVQMVFSDRYDDGWREQRG